MGSCTSGNRNARAGAKSIRETVITNGDHFSNPHIRAKIFSNKDSKAPKLNLEINTLRNKRIMNIQSNLTTQHTDH